MTSCREEAEKEEEEEKEATAGGTQEAARSDYVSPGGLVPFNDELLLPSSTLRLIVRAGPARCLVFYPSVSPSLF